jgi:hypothetical protein
VHCLSNQEDLHMVALFRGDAGELQGPGWRC